MIAALDRLLAQVEHRVAAHVGERHGKVTRQFLQFALIGVQGFAWDNAVVYSTAPFVGPYWAAVFSYFIVGTINWGLNRVWTYRDHDHGPLRSQLPKFLAANAIGFVLNRGTFALMVATLHIPYRYYVFPLAMGTGAGMIANFVFSRRFVFHQSPHE